MRLAIFTLIHREGKGEDAARTVLPNNIGTWRETGGDELGEGWEETSFTAYLNDEDTIRLLDDMDTVGLVSEPNLGILSEFGWLESDHWDFDGMDWNIGGVTPVEHVTLRLSAPVMPDDEYAVLTDGAPGGGFQPSGQPDPPYDAQVATVAYDYITGGHGLEGLDHLGFIKSRLKG